MLAFGFEKTGKIENGKILDIQKPQIEEGEVLIKVSSCGVCRTDLHIAEGELPQKISPLIPGHQVVGYVEISRSKKFKVGDRVGLTWLWWACGKCKFCLEGKENLCDSAIFTGYSTQGGFAEFVKSHENFTFKIPQGYGDDEFAPHLCAGVIGWRALRLSEVREGEKLGLIGFGSSAYLVAQMAKILNIKVFVFTRGKKVENVDWVGSLDDNIKVDKAIVFAPAGEIIDKTLQKIEKGGKVIINAIYSTPIKINYQNLWHEKEIKSVANITRKDIEDYLLFLQKNKIKTQIETFPLYETEKALKLLKEGKIKISAVIKI